LNDGDQLAVRREVLDGEDYGDGPGEKYPGAANRFEEQRFQAACSWSPRAKAQAATSASSTPRGTLCGTDHSPERRTDYEAQPPGLLRNVTSNRIVVKVRVGEESAFQE
jgi:hypothetical protein